MSNEQQNNTNSESSRQAADELNKNIDFFFDYTPYPTECNPRPQGKDWSTLHLLRQEITYCFEKRNAIWPATMAIFAGIDLLAKYHSGNDLIRDGKVGERFQEFIKEYLELSVEDDRTAIWQLRNSMLHSFGLYSKKVRPKKREKEEEIVKAYKFTVTRHTLKLIHETGTEYITEGTEQHPVIYYTIDVSILQQEFERGVRQYYNDLRIKQNPDLRKNFKHIYDLNRYNAVRIG
jgi:hypothetical protein